MSEQMVCRIKPYNKRAGCLIRSYTYAGKRYLEGKGWYKCSPDLAAKLKRLRADDSNPHSPYVFDVATVSEAIQIEADETPLGERRTALQSHAEPQSTRSARPKRKAKPQGARPVRQDPPELADIPKPQLEAVEPQPLRMADDQDAFDDDGDEESPLGPPDLGGDDEV